VIPDPPQKKKGGDLGFLRLTLSVIPDPPPIKKKSGDLGFLGIQIKYLKKVILSN